MTHTTEPMTLDRASADIDAELAKQREAAQCLPWHSL
jgi:hypothetical protein